MVPPVKGLLLEPPVAGVEGVEPGALGLLAGTDGTLTGTLGVLPGMLAGTLGLGSYLLYQQSCSKAVYTNALCSNAG